MYRFINGKMVSLISLILDHPGAVKELLKLERSLFDFVKPGADGKFNSSDLAVRLKELNAAGLDEFWIYPVVFGAGSISMVIWRLIKITRHLYLGCLNGS